MYSICLSYFDKSYALNCYYVVTTLDVRLIDLVQLWLSDYSPQKYRNDAEFFCKSFGSLISSITKSSCVIDAIYPDNLPEYDELDIEGQLSDNMIFLFFEDGDVQVSLDKESDYMSKDEFLVTHIVKSNENIPGIIHNSLYFDIRGDDEF